MGLFDSYGINGILGDMFTSCTMMDRVTDSASDGVFGIIEHFKPGAKITAALIKLDSDEAAIAEADDLKEKYRVVVPAGVALNKNDVIRRDSDGMTFRMTSNTRDGAAPAASTVQIAKAACTPWEIPDTEVQTPAESGAPEEVSAP